MTVITAQRAFFHNGWKGVEVWQHKRRLLQAMKSNYVISWEADATTFRGQYPFEQSFLMKVAIFFYIDWKGDLKSFFMTVITALRAFFHNGSKGVEIWQRKRHLLQVMKSNCVISWEAEATTLRGQSFFDESCMIFSRGWKRVEILVT